MNAYVQLEFDFTNNKSFLTDHFSPQVGWDVYNSELTGTGDINHKVDSINNIWNNVLDHIRLGFTFKWKF